MGFEMNVINKIPEKRTSFATKIEELLIPIHISEVILAPDQHYWSIRTKASDLRIPNHFTIS